MLFLILYMAAVGAVSAKGRDVVVKLDADTVVDGFKAAMRSEYLRNLADEFASKAARYLIEELERKNKRVKSSQFGDHSGHKVGRKGSGTSPRESGHGHRHTDRHSQYLNVSLLSGQKVPDHENAIKEYRRPQNERETVETESKPKDPEVKESKEQLLKLLKEPSADGDYPNREGELTDYEAKKNAKPIRTEQMINGKRFRARSIDFIYL